MSAAQEREIEILIRARYPLIYLVTWEELRAERMLERVAKRRKRPILLWSVTTGLCEGGRLVEPATREPRGVLEHIASSEHEALYVLRDFHPWMKDPTLVRRLRDLVHRLRAHRSNVIILSPTLELPVELEKDLTVLDYELPGPEELRRVLHEAEASGDHGKRYKVELEAKDEEQLIQAALGMTESEAENAIARAIVIDRRLDRDDVVEILREKKQIIRKARLLEYYEANETLATIGGMDLLKSWFAKRGSAFTEKARAFGLPQPRGVLLLGVQGCGKSLACKIVASLWKLPLLRLDMGAIFGGFVGQSEENMRRAIKTAEAIAPCVLWLDEIEKGLAGSGSPSQSDSGTTARVFSTFLTWLQEKTKPVFVAATANDIRSLPPELLRKGRLDEIFFVDLPTTSEREEIFAIHLHKTGRDPSQFDLTLLAETAEGFSGAEIEQVVVSGLHEAFHRHRELTLGDMEVAIKLSVPLSKTMQREIDSLRDWASTRARAASSRSNPMPPTQPQD